MILQRDTYILVLVIVLYDGFDGTDTLMFAEKSLYHLFYSGKRPSRLEDPSAQAIQLPRIFGR